MAAEEQEHLRLAESRIALQDAEQGAVAHQFHPDASPADKAAAARRNMPASICTNKTSTHGAALITDMSKPAQDVVPNLPPVDPNAAIDAAKSPKSPTLDSSVSSKDTTLAGWEAVGESRDFLQSFLDDSWFGQAWQHAGVVFFVGFCSWIIGRLNGGIAWILIILATAATYYQTSIKALRRNVRDDISRELIKQKLETDNESAEWMNTFLIKFWAIYEPVLSATIIASVDQVLATSTPAFLDSLRLSTFTLGTKPPRIEHVKTYPKSDDEIVLMDWRFSFTPNDLSDLTGKQLKNKVNPKVVLSVRVGKGLISGGMPVLVEDMAFSGLMRIKLRLMYAFPHIQLVDLSFLERPSFEYVLKPLGGDKFGFDIGNVPGLSSFIQEQVHANLGPMMYAPNVFTVNVEQMLSGAPIDSAIGVLQITLYGARGLAGNPDPYVKFSINTHGELDRTKVVKNTSCPRWNETKYLLITGLNESLTLEVFDFNEFRKDKHLGTASFELKSLEADAEQENVVAPIMYNATAKGQVTFDLSYYPTLTATTIQDGTSESIPETVTGIVRFTVHQAKDLDPKLSFVGHLDPFAVFLLNGQEIHTSKKMKRTNNPIWEESFEFLVVNRPSCKLGVMLKDDRGLQKDPQIGSYQIKLDTLMQANQNGRDWFALANCNSGKIKLSAQWKPIAMTGGIHGTGGYSMPIGVMRFHFKAAKDVRNVEAKTGGKSDPYVRIMVLNDVRAKTVVIQSELNPHWDEILYVPLHSEKEIYTLEVMDWQNLTHDRSLGFTEVSASDLIKQDENNGEYLENSARVERTEPLISRSNHNSAKGHLIYNASFYPCLNVADPMGTGNDTSMETETDLDLATDYDVSDGEASLHRKMSKVPEPSKTPDKVTESAHGSSEHLESLQESASSNNSSKKRKVSPPKVHLTPEELLNHNSGILIWNIIEAEVVKKDSYLQIYLDDLPNPSYTSSKTRSKHAKFDEVGDGFVRELDLSLIRMRLMDKDTNSDDDVIAKIQGSTHTILKQALNNPTDITLRGNDGSSLCKVKISLKYIPVKIHIDARESVNNMGNLRLDVLSGTNLPAADRSGFSDPYCVFELNDEKVHKTKIIKKTLNPTWTDETFTVAVPNRSTAQFWVKVYDWDRGNKDDFLGASPIDLSQLEPMSASTQKLILDGKSGDIKVRLLFQPEYVTRQRRGSSGFASTFAHTGVRALSTVAGAPVRLVGGVERGVGHGLGQLLGRKGSKLREVAPEDQDVAVDVVASGGGIMGGTNGTFAITEDKKTIPLDNAVPDQTAIGPGDARMEFTPSKTPSLDHRRTPSSITSRASLHNGSMGDMGIAQITILEGSGFPDEKIQVRIRNSKKELYKTKSVKSSNPQWNEDFHFTAFGSDTLIVSVYQHHSLKSDEEVGSTSFALEQHAAGDVTLTIGDAKLRLRLNFKPTDASSMKSASRSSRLRALSPFNNNK
ncbi:hypothetical protein NEOLI_001252 [Neolecta irregularis DAH-3]|uniref:Tricalbin-1 n=1 Tax=Neolecta irregularis (strain DAH-3) TaxID=1198029 RepID=A0A1U7LLP6_NEOID|nr:hypothetical protein NEOLI_001252 [Neolecta irregularis DAH-3]|eukprot:OLL23513.1 hypothetical protein NEOLI_001252 [Neolecta irregularis DAH-3]